VRARCGQGRNCDAGHLPPRSCFDHRYALLCGSLPFDDEVIANLFKKIKSGTYTLPTHLGEAARDLLPRMLVVGACTMLLEDLPGCRRRAAEK
jgi:hypothetical protein